MKYANFIPGKWYICSCNTNYYRFLEFTPGTNNQKITFDAQINPTKKECGSVIPGFTKKTTTGSYAEYFNPDRMAINEWTIKYTKQLNYEIY